jgi:pentose-5-phosphate-3-epimerase
MEGEIVAVDTAVVPAVLTGSKEEYATIVKDLNRFAKRVQVDITDGDFVPTTTIPLSNVWWPKEWRLDIHLMVSRPSETVETLSQLRPSLAIFPAETGENLLPTFQKIKELGIRTGVALLKTTFPGKVAQYIQAADHVLIMGGDLGRQGGKIDMMQIEKVPLIRKINQKVEIGWDGGINIENIRAIAHSGVDVLNVGNAIQGATDREKAYKELVAEAEKRGVRV